LARRLPTERAWDRQAVAAVLNDLFLTQRALVEVILRSSAGSVPPQLIIDAWCSKRQSLVDRNSQLVAELQATLSPNFAMLAVANGQLKSLLADAQKSVTLTPPTPRR
jgi:glutamate dehydrogenase